MIMRVGIENNNDNRSIAWALEHPGCFAYGADAAEAQANMQGAVEDYAAWVRGHGLPWMDDDPIEVRMEEVFDAYMVYPEGEARGGYLIESFFQSDREPLTGTDVDRALKLLEWSRHDLLEAIEGLSEQQLDEKRPGEKWSIRGILSHVAGGEWFYQERIGLPFPEREDDLPGDALASLELVRAHFKSVLAGVVGVKRVLEVEGETWSPRKMLRRTAWHERDHTQHILKLR
jgi:hypothetical protein